MYRPRVIPALLLKNKGLVKTIRFDRKDPKYIGDPINAVRIFNDLDADELMFLDITASEQKRSVSVELVKNIGDEAYMPFAVGGGITTLDQIREIMTNGAEKVVLNTITISNPSLIREASEVFGNQSIIVSIDVKKDFLGRYKVAVAGGTRKTDISPVEHAWNMYKMGAGEIMITSIQQEGTMSGYDYELIRAVSEKVPIPVIACGGAGNLEHLKMAVEKGKADAVAAGSIFVFHGPRNAVLVNYPDRIALTKLFN